MHCCNVLTFCQVGFLESNVKLSVIVDELFAVICMKVLQYFNNVHHTSLVKLTDEKPCLIVEVVCVFAQHEVSSDVQTSANDVHFPVTETDSHMQPVVVLERLDLTR